jgi:hypothetical protein
MAKAKTHSPFFWSHVHRYMPSDRVWCEDTATNSIADAQTAQIPNEWHDMVITQESIKAPDVAEITADVLYVAHIAQACPCAWKRDAMCLLPDDVCNVLQPAFEDTNRWTALFSTGTFNSSSDIMFVRLALQNSATNLPSCREYTPSTVWGLLDSTQQYDWHNGGSRQWSVSLQEIASFGPGRMRPSDLLASSPRDFDAEMRLRSCTTSLAPPTLKSRCSG